jgi:hypothetical protein
LFDEASKVPMPTLDLKQPSQQFVSRGASIRLAYLPGQLEALLGSPITAKLDRDSAPLECGHVRL